MEAWPTSILPAPTVTFTGTKESAIERTQMDSGRTRRRRRFTAEQRTYSAVWEFSDVQFGLFQSWFLHKINDGADSFTLNLPTGDGLSNTVTATFADGKYTQKHKPGTYLYWDVSTTLEVTESPVWSESVYDAILIIGDPETLTLAAEELHELIHETLPA